MTEQERQELIKDCQEEIEALTWRLFRTYSTGGCPDYLNSCLRRQEIALKSLQSEVAGYKWFHEGSPESRGWYADCYPLSDELLSKSESISQYQPLYAAPPVQAVEIKMPEPLVEHKSGLFAHMPTLLLKTPEWADGYNEALMDVKLLNEVN